ncbi:phospholipase/carboxylesterase [Roseovarius azorensis]|uniref:Phospholipase/carboxylesterase n=1 Tax=Roseovarius azorensis TaxID=1287727 RepID=A0A1H7TRQ6_9RHOB|nr:VOC family protein [Roseovarius azorensis]SEL87086.1 phospholipase/carboxylesterase [Roseovarius azorensis]
MATGLHHVTGITRNVQANVDFYMGFLGLRLIKQTGGYEDAGQLHLFYGDAQGTPGSIISFLVWQDGAPGRVGHGQVGEVAFAVPLDSIGEWMRRMIEARVAGEQPTREFGETVLRLKDPDGIIIKLVGIDLSAVHALPDPIAPTRLRSVTLFTNDAAATADFAMQFGYRNAAVEDQVRRLISATDVIDVRDTRGFFSGIPGTGVIDHVAFRAPDEDAVRRMRLALGLRHMPTNVHDRKYFLSLYLRDPTNILFEYATDAPGFAVDESPETLGTRLIIPDRDSERAEDLRIMLPQFARPGEPRMPKRDLTFTHRLRSPQNPDGSTTLLLHGTGGSEADLMPFAARLNPRATLLGLRGRATEEGVARFFRRFAPDVFDQDDIRAEADAFDAFLPEALRGYALDTENLTVFGYSNGANFAAAIMALHPGIIRRAILVRAIPVLVNLPMVDLAGTEVLLLAGTDDPRVSRSRELAMWLTRCGADCDLSLVSASHDIVAQDLEVARDWLRRQSEASTRSVG